MAIGDKIKAFRELRGLSVEQLADKMGIGKAGIYKWEKNNTTPSIESLTEISKALDCKIMDLIEENHTPVPNEAAVPENISDPRQPIYEELYEKFLGANSEYLVIHRDVLKNHRIVAVETLEKERKQAENAQQEIAERIKQIDKLTDMNGKLADLIGVASSRPINIQLAQPEKT